MYKRQILNNGGANLTAVGCSFSGNTAIDTVGGGLTNEPLAQATLVGCILWGNGDTTGSLESGQIANSAGGVLVVDYSCIEGLTSSFGVGNIDQDPLFADATGFDNVAGTLDDDLRLCPSSPCIDAGSNPAVPPDDDDLDGDGDLLEPIPLDLDGTPRFEDDPDTPDTGIGPAPVIDMGAYEGLDPGPVSYTHLTLPTIYSV